ncbi:24-methylenesterol C-methyltransferase 2-like [Zingiber officinale]|uniref:24-methylenesterol C-methyltransferase 2-like n=1 Tax=Zingiber officinale TaxID=94328 RepID=UPI001C4B0FB2|nr:24-methylenesterol C-methyltransferase 2-like [Zingiber officinale]
MVSELPPELPFERRAIDLWTAAVVSAITVYWFVWVMSSAEVKGKRAVNLKMGSIMQDKVQDKYKQYWSFFLRSKEGIVAASDDDNVPAFIDTFYNLVTDIYEWGWGQSFHFSPSLPGRSHREATRIHEEPAADLRDGDLISQRSQRSHRSDLAIEGSPSPLTMCDESP